MIKRSGGVKLFVFNLIFYFNGEVTSRPMIYVRKQLARITLLNEFAAIFFFTSRLSMKFQVFNALWGFYLHFLWHCIFCLKSQHFEILKADYHQFKIENEFLFFGILSIEMNENVDMSHQLLPKFTSNSFDDASS